MNASVLQTHIYMKSKINYLDYQGEKVPYSIGYFALSQWQEETGKSLIDIDSLEDNLLMLEPLFFHAVIAGYKIVDKLNKRSREELQFVLDLCWLQFIAGMKDFFPKGVKAQTAKE